MKKIKLSPINLLILFSLFNILFITIKLIATNGAFLSEIVWDARNNLFADFTSHVRRAGTLNPYNIDDWDARFPALAYLFYYILSRMIPITIPNSIVENWGHMFMCIVLCLNVYIITYMINKFFKNQDYTALGIGIVFFLSQPFAVSEIKAANSAIYTLSLMLIALYLRNSENKKLKEIALIIIALAAGFKVSPAILGIMYIKERRYKEAFRLTMYGIVFFFLPFMFWGGISAIKAFINITSQVSNATIPRPETIIGVVLEFADITGLESELGLIIGKIISYVFFLTIITIFLLTKMDWKSMFLLSTLMIVFVNQSYPYTLQYLLIPIIYFALEVNCSPKKMDYIYALLFAMVLTSYPIIKINWPTATFITNYFFLYIMIILVWSEKCRASINVIKEWNNTRKKSNI